MTSGISALPPTAASLAGIRHAEALTSTTTRIRVRICRVNQVIWHLDETFSQGDRPASSGHRVGVDQLLDGVRDAEEWPLE